MTLNSMDGGTLMEKQKPNPKPVDKKAWKKPRKFVIFSFPAHKKVDG